MTLAFDADAGQMALIEPDQEADAQHWPDNTVSGVISTEQDGQVVVDLGQSAASIPNGDVVVASVFAPEALYRLRATARQLGGGVIALDDVIDIERIQRRRWTRHALHLNVTLAPMDGSDGDFIGVTGRTLDVGMGGLRTQTLRRLPPGADPTVMLTLLDGTVLVLASRVVQSEITDDGCEYRVAFHDMDDDDAARLGALLRQAEEMMPPSRPRPANTR